MREKTTRGVAAVVGLVVIVAVLLFAYLRMRMAGVPESDIDPAAWAERFPDHYESFMNTRIDYGRTAHGGSSPYDKLASNPFRQRAWAGHPFALEYRAARGHHYAQIDQRESRRTRERDQPAACVHCHAAEAPGLVEAYGWEAFHARRYAELQDRLHFGTSCADCHDPATLELRVTRTAFRNALERRGIELAGATRQEMRTYVCAQCHSEYYTRGELDELVHPWDHGLRVEEIERYFDDHGFRDFIHAETGAPLIKIQHPEFELASTGIHARLNISCSDCHMPRIRQSGISMSDHWIRSPLTNVGAACMSCHAGTEAELVSRVVDIQDRTTELLGVAEAALADLMDAVVSARRAGVDEHLLDEALTYHRRAQLRWDFVDAENSTGSHSSREAARILTHAVDLARRGERSAHAATSPQELDDASR